MEESLRTRIVLIFAISSALFLIIAVGSCSSAHRMQIVRDSEMARRLDLEEKLSKLQQENALLTEKMKAKDKELNEGQATNKALVQEQLVNQSLKEELAKVTKLKEALEEDLKEALVSGKVKAKTNMR